MKPHPESQAPPANNQPLCVDLDGTLLTTDTAQEQLLAFLKQHFWQVWRLPLWLLKGRAFCKRQLAQRVQLDVAALPRSDAFVDHLRAQHAAGRRIVLATGADQRTAAAVAGHFGFFAEVLASDGQTNLIGQRKCELLLGRFGQGGFDYAGNSSVDLPIWRAARERLVVNASPALEQRVARQGGAWRAFGTRRGFLSTLGRLLRLHQWAKNILVLVPVITAHEWFQPGVVWQALLGLLAFCLCSSSVYVANDLQDLEADRRHRTKRARPLAAGRCSIACGLVLAPLLALLGLACAHFLPWLFLGYLVLYCLASLAYSSVFKRLVLLDVLVLTGLYTLRILAGHGATGIPYSGWLLGFSMFLFLSLALMKRYIELRRLHPEAAEPIRGRDYQAADLPGVLSLGTASGYLAVLVLALYINSEQVRLLYRRPLLLLLICPLLLYWVSRAWLLAGRDQVEDDPVVFALRDKSTYMVGALAAVVIWLASSG